MIPRLSDRRRSRAASGFKTPAQWNTKGAGPVEVVVTDAKLRQSLVAVRSLGRRGYRVGAVECLSARGVPTFSSRWCAATARVEDREVDPDTMIRQIVDLASSSSRDVVVIPSHDGTIAALDQHRQQVEPHCRLALARSGPLRAANDKRLTLGAARRLGIRVPEELTVESLDEIDAAVASMPMPAVLKPAQSWITTGTARRRLGVSLVSSPTEARARLRELVGTGAFVLVQEWVPGERLAVSFLHADGRFHGEFAQVAQRMLPIVGGSSVMRESVALPEDARSDARRLVTELELEGYAEVEFRRDVDGVPVLMEVNPRLSASIECAMRAGIDFPGLVRDWATGQLPDQTGQSYRVGVRVRWLSADIKWLIDNARHQGAAGSVSNRRAVSSFFKEFGRPTSYDYFDARDLRPALTAIGADIAWLAGLMRRGSDSRSSAR